MTNPNGEASPVLDLDTLVAQAQAELDEPAETEADEGGPDDESGELPEADAPFAADEEEDDLPDADDDAEQDDDDDDDQEDLEDEEDLEDADDDDDQADDEPDPQEERFLALEEKLEASLRKTAELERTNQELAQFVREGSVPEPQRRQQRDPEFTKAWRAAHVHGAEAIKDFDPKIQREVADLALQLQEAKADWALDPRAEYQTRFELFVEQAIEKRMAPLDEARRKEEIASVLEPHREFLEKNRALVLRNLPDDFGAKNPDDPRVLKARLEMAVKLAKAKLAEGGLKKREGKVKAKSRQQEAKSRSRRKSSRKPRKGRGTAPRIQGVDGDSLQNMANQLANDPDALKEAERKLGR